MARGGNEDSQMERRIKMVKRMIRTMKNNTTEVERFCERGERKSNRKRKANEV